MAIYESLLRIIWMLAFLNSVARITQDEQRIIERDHIPLIWMLAYEFIRRIPQDDRRMIRWGDNISQTFSLRFSQTRYPQQRPTQQPLQIDIHESHQNTLQDDIPEKQVRTTEDRTTKGRADPFFQRVRDKIPAAFKEKASSSYAKGACQNCGSMDHDRKSCFERPKARYSPSLALVKKAESTKRSSNSIYCSSSLSKPQLGTSRANKAAYLLKEEPKPEFVNFSEAHGRCAWDHPRVPIVRQYTCVAEDLSKEKVHTDHDNTYVAEDLSRHVQREEQKEEERGEREEQKEEEIGEWERHTKGVGSTILKKYGFREGEGLGAKGEGITSPISVTKLPRKVGLEEAITMIKKGEGKKKGKEREEGDKEKKF